MEYLFSTSVIWVMGITWAIMILTGVSFVLLTYKRFLYPSYLDDVLVVILSLGTAITVAHILLYIGSFFIIAFTTIIVLVLEIIQTY